MTNRNNPFGEGYLTAEQREAADTDGDGKITISDATMIQKYIAEIIDHF